MLLYHESSTIKAVLEGQGVIKSDGLGKMRSPKSSRPV